MDVNDLKSITQCAGELVGDEDNAEALCRLVEHGKSNLVYYWPPC